MEYVASNKYLEI